MTNQVIHEGDEVNHEGTCSICGHYFNVALKVDCACDEDNRPIEEQWNDAIPEDFDDDRDLLDNGEY